jgi:DNA-binding NarL/FixJ family response regulator
VELNDSHAAVSVAGPPDLSTSSTGERHLPPIANTPTVQKTDETEPVHGTGPEPITVLIVDDHDGFRAGLTTLLVDHGFDVVGDAGDGETAITLVATLAPDVVLMDLQMPGLSGLETTRRIAKASPATAVLILTVSADEADVVDAMLGGGCGYLVKGTSPETVVAGIQAAARGEFMISAEVASRLFGRLRPSGAAASPEALLPTSVLSTRELEILRLLASGKQNDDIAHELVISPFTVRNHVSNLLRKLQLENRTQAAAYAIRHGL